MRVLRHFPTGAFAIRSCGFHFHIVNFIPALNFIPIINFIFAGSRKYFLEIVENATQCVRTRRGVSYMLKICLKARCTINAFITNTKAVIMDYIHYKIFVMI